MTALDLGPWDPLSPKESGDLFRDYAGFWCIAGGWALDLYAGRQSRTHDDIDVLVKRSDLSLLHEALPGWELHAAKGTLTPWLPRTLLPSDVHDIWCRRDRGPWRFQFMVIDVIGTDWIFRRDDRIRGPLTTMTLRRDGLPILAPEIQLLYKARLPNRPKDEADFATIAPLLDPDRRVWLTDAVSFLYPSHPWNQ